MADTFMNEGPKWLFIILWLCGNGIQFGYTFWYYHTDPLFYYLRVLLGISLPCARGAAAALNLNCSLILLPVCRNLISFIRGSCRCMKRNISRQLDKNIEFHKLCAYAICFWTAVHYYSHTFNFERLFNAWTVHDNASSIEVLRYQLSLLPELINPTPDPNYTSPDNSWTNPIRNSSDFIVYTLAKAVPGFTGVIATLALCVMVTSSTEFIRRNYFEVFWYTHHLFVIFFAAIIAHGFGGVVRHMTNSNVHNVTLCHSQPETWGSADCPTPTFAPRGAQTWMWVVGPCCLYLIERLIRFSRSQQKVEIVKVIQHPARVMELQMRKRGFRMTSGQYIFVQCPMISRLEWHPFTLTSSPDEGHFSVHIREAGDWTSALHKKFHCSDKPDKPEVDLQMLPNILVDGPFGTCSEDVFRYDVAVLVSAGIGVTPFASILKHIWYRRVKADYKSKLRQIYFFWLCPETHAFGWFIDLLKCLEQQMEAEYQPDFVKINIYWTRPNVRQITYITEHAGASDIITGLRSPTCFGRPNWNKLFADMKNDHPGTNIGVFFCGPAVLASELHKISNQQSSKNPKETHFVFNKENF